jgi:uncharacterized membrane protein
VLSPGSPPLERAEEAVAASLDGLRLVVEVMGGAAIGLGVAVSAVAFGAALAGRGRMDFTGVRLTLARYLALALEFQLGADILSTAVAPTWEQIGKLGAIVVIRTTLNVFLRRELQETVPSASAQEARAHAEPGRGV